MDRQRGNEAFAARMRAIRTETMQGGVRTFHRDAVVALDRASYARLEDLALDAADRHDIADARYADTHTRPVSFNPAIGRVLVVMEG